MKRIALILLAGVLAPAAFAQSADETKIVDLLAQARASCGPGGATLRWSPVLAKVAGRVQKGEKAGDAIGAEGYRAVRLVRTNATSPAADEVAKLVAKDNCSALTDARVSDVAYVRTGNEWVVLLAAPLAAPQLADKKAVAQKVLALVNDARKQPRTCGADKVDAGEPLQWNAKLEEAAAAHAKDMATNSFLSPTGKDESTPPQRIARVGYKASKSTESVAAGLDSPERVVQQWLSEPESCRNIMDAAFTETAVAYEVNTASRSFVYWALELATPAATKGEPRAGNVPEREAPKPEQPLVDRMRR